MKTILIIGGGEIGKALHHILSGNSSHNITIWDKEASRATSSESLEVLVSASEFIFLCIPSFAFTEVVERIATHISKDATIISLTKGIDQLTHQFSSEILEMFAPSQYVLLSGPMLAEEILSGKPTSAILAGERSSVEKTVLLFSNTLLSIESNDDAFTIALLGVFKNVYAILFGVLDALDLGANTRGVMMSKALLEMREVIKLLGGDGEAIYTLAGIGDLLATSTSEYSTNRTIGRQIIETHTCSMESEGCRALEPLKHRVDVHAFPVLSSIYEIISLDVDPKEKIISLLSYE